MELRDPWPPWATATKPLEPGAPSAELANRVQLHSGTLFSCS